MKENACSFTDYSRLNSNIESMLSFNLEIKLTPIDSDNEYITSSADVINNNIKSLLAVRKKTVEKYLALSNKGESTKNILTEHITLINSNLKMILGL